MSTFYRRVGLALSRFAAVRFSHFLPSLLLLLGGVLLARLAVFHGGFTVEAAAAVCGGEGGVPEDTDGMTLLLQELHRRSLLVTEGPPRRYRLLETVRQYAGDRLADWYTFKPTARLGRRRREASCLDRKVEPITIPGSPSR